MKTIRSLAFQIGSKEEKLPYDTPDFPYLASRAELDPCREPSVPWHWHSAIELFYMESGELEYYTPHGGHLFPAGTAGMVNANVLHKTQAHTDGTVQLLHIFSPQLLAGAHGGLIEQKYIAPITAAPQIELVALSPDEPAQAAVIGLIRAAFSLPEGGFGYELKVREALSRVWLGLLPLCAPLLEGEAPAADAQADQVKAMMAYIHGHYAEKIPIRALASAAFLSERACYRAFRAYLHMTPAEYIRGYRVQIARQLLAEGRAPITEVGIACGMGNTSYFGKVFREATGYTPRQYRQKWQDKNTT